MHMLGVRREDRDEWEARAPLIPQDIARLNREDSIEFVLQPSPARIFAEAEYLSAGAGIDEDMSACDAVLAVKEIPSAFFRPNKTYMFFSHTIKGQPYNMDMLRRLMELGCQLIDYERITDDYGKRLIFFSRFAGIAGTIDSLWALGRRLECEGLIPNPFAEIRQTYRYRSLAVAVAAVSEAGRRIAEDGLPAEICPFVIGLAGYGNASAGAQEITEPLGAVAVPPSGLDDPSRAPIDRRVVYKTVFTEQDLFGRRDGASPFDLNEYYEQPELYEGRFEPYLPQLAVLINCIYWDARYPRLLTKQAARELFGGDTPPLLRVIGDVSCDVDGSIELTVKETHVGDPLFVYEPGTDTISDGVEGRGPIVIPMGNFPCELPRESSEAFSAVLSPFMPSLAEADFDVPFERLDLVPELRRALILHHGELTPDYAYMGRFV